MRPLFPHVGAFFADALLRRALTYAVVLYGAEVLGSGRWAGALYFGVMLPYLASWYAGVVIDRETGRGTLRVSALVIAVVSVLIAAASIAPVAQGPAVVVLLLAYGTASAFVYPAFIAGVPQVASGDRVVTATIVMNALSLGCYIAGPVAVGALRTVLAWPAVFLSLSVLAVVSVGLVWLSSPSVSLGDPWRHEHDRALPSPIVALRTTWQYVRQDRLVRPLLLLVALFSGMVVGPIEVLMPLFATETLHLSPLASGAFLATGGAGMVVGALIALRIARAGRVSHRLPLMGVVGGLVMIAMTVTAGTAAVALYLMAGILAGMFSSLALAAVQAAVPDADRGRAMGLYTLVLGTPPAVGGATCGWLLDAMAAPIAIRWTFGSVVIVFALVFVWTRSTLAGARARAPQLSSSG